MESSPAKPITTRAAESGDLEFLERTFLLTLREAITGARGSWDEDRERTQFRQQLRLEQTWIVRRDKKEVGFYTAILEPARLMLGTLCILPEYQSQAIGATLMQSLIQQAQAQSTSLVLNVLKSNLRARSFYQGLGFAVVGESTHHHELHYLQRTPAA